MPNELNLQFPDRTRVIVTLNRGVAGRTSPFASPLTEKDHADIRWYLETYGAHSLGDPDDGEARRIAKQLPVWGRALFNAVFTDPAAFKRFVAFQQMEKEARLLTISAEDPSILLLPWELLHDPSESGGFLFLENPRISIRRRVQGADDGRQPFDVVPKDRVHLLFVVSRPEDAGFLDPRADSLPVLDAIDEHAPGRVTCEFLRPPTLDALLERLEDKSKAPVDIVHFDGHGVFDRKGGLPERAAQREGSRFSFDEATVKDARGSGDSPPNTGYLLFETPDGKRDFVSAAKLGANLHRHNVALVILSACQSGAVAAANGASEAEDSDGEKSAMGSVAARLTATGIPSVLAMTHSVLVHTTRALFGEFYEELARSKAIGEALDNARRYLANHPEKYQVQRGPARVPLQLYDWFLPALYQPGADGPLLKEITADNEELEFPAPRTNLPAVAEAGFFGRRRDLWQIERWFAGPTRRITITGFGGQGKTALALEAGRWLTRVGLFQAAVFVDYSRIQAEDAVAVAVSTIADVVGESLIDADAAARALRKMPTLVILDNLEALPQQPLHALLDAAVRWSEGGGSRVLCTTRRPTFEHAQYRVEGTVVHRRIVLDGLGSRSAPDDALEWYAALMKLPPAPVVPAPKRAVLIELFERVKFHPLSIRVLTQQLKTRGPAELGVRLEELLAAPSSNGVADEGTPASLLASLQISLDRLDVAAREMLPRLGVFQGGAFEDDLQAITGLDESADNSWPALRQQLEGAALIEAESIPGVPVPFLRFHPTLAPILRAQLSAEDLMRLSEAHRRRYYALSGFLYNQDNRNPHVVRAIAWRELPNLLHAANAAFDAGDPGAVDFADSMNRFLGMFGLRQDAHKLTARAEASSGDYGSEAWILAQTNRGEQLLKNRQVSEAVKVFQAILEQLGDEPTYRKASILGQLGRCFEVGGFADQAERYQRQGLAVSSQLVQSDGVKSLRARRLSDLADVLRMQGQYAEARKAYEAALELNNELHDLSSQGAVLGQLGTLALYERADGWFADAAQRYSAALQLFEQLHEPVKAAVAHHQLGVLFHAVQEWDEAEKHYRSAARIKNEIGDVSGANSTWNQLGLVSRESGKLDAAEQWFRKAIDGARESTDLFALSTVLSNLAGLLQMVPGRLADARTNAEEALKIKKSLDADVSEIWKIYSILASIADQETTSALDATRVAELHEQARGYRRMARAAKFEFAGTRNELRKHGSLIHDTIGAVSEPERRLQLEQALPGLEQSGWTNLVAAIRRILAGERDSDALCEPLDAEDSMIVEAILSGLTDPSSVADLLPEAET